MGEFKSFDDGEPFVQPEKPFLLIYESREDGVGVAWFSDEEDLRECVEEIRGYGCEVIDAIEIGNYRDIDIKE